MRVKKGPDGNFIIIDEAIRLEGDDAERFLQDMKRVDDADDDGERKALLARFAQVYRKVEEKRSK